MSGSSERNHEPTPIRLRQARASGDIAKSNELAAALSMIGAIGAGYLTFQQIARWLQTSTISLWQHATPNLDAAQTIESTQTLLFSLAGVLLPFTAMLVFLSVVASWIQTGPVWLPEKISPKIENLGPGKWRRQLSASNLLSVTGLGVPKVAIALAVMTVGTWCQRNELFALASAPADLLVSRLFEIVLVVCLQVAAALAVLGVADYSIQWLGHRRRMRMSPQEVRQEQRAEGGANSVTRAKISPESKNSLATLQQLKRPLSQRPSA